MARPDRPGRIDGARHFQIPATDQDRRVLPRHLHDRLSGLDLARAAGRAAANGVRGRPDRAGGGGRPRLQPVRTRRARPVRPGRAHQAAVHRPDPPAAQAHPHHHRRRGGAGAPLGQPAHARAEPQPAAGPGLDALLRVGDADRGRLRRGRAGRGGRSRPAAVQEDGEDRRRGPGRGDRGERRRRAADRVQHARGAAQRQDPGRPGRRRPAHRAAAGRHPAAARRAGGGDRRLHRGRHRQPAPAATPPRWTAPAAAAASPTPPTWPW